MSERRIRPATRLRGECRVPSDKSIAHRALLMGAVGEGVTRIMNFDGGADNRSTIAFLRALGVLVREAHGEIRVVGGGWDALREPGGPIDCGNSGTTMRMGAGLLAGRPLDVRLTGDASLSRRPMSRVVEPLRAMGARIRCEGEGGRPPLFIQGGDLRGITYRLPVASAQVKSAILIAGLQASGETTVVETRPTRDHTERLLRAFGVSVRLEEGRDEEGAPARRITVSGPARLRSVSLSLPGDFSSAAFIVVAASLVPGSDVVIRDVGLNPSRTALLDVLESMGADVVVERTDGSSEEAEPRGSLRVRASELHGVTVDPSLVPRLIDEIPLLCVAAACARGVTKITGAGELRVKESDRIATTAGELAALGMGVTELPDGMVVEGAGSPRSGARVIRGGRVRSHGDHRIAMALAVAGLAASAEVVIEDAEAADVSYPRFYEQLGELSSG